MPFVNILQLFAFFLGLAVLIHGTAVDMQRTLAEKGNIQTGDISNNEEPKWCDVGYEDACPEGEYCYIQGQHCRYCTDLCAVKADSFKKICKQKCPEEFSRQEAIGKVNEKSQSSKTTTTESTEALNSNEYEDAKWCDIGYEDECSEGEYCYIQGQHCRSCTDLCAVKKDSFKRICKEKCPEEFLREEAIRKVTEHSQTSEITTAESTEASNEFPQRERMGNNQISTYLILTLSVIIIAAGILGGFVVCKSKSRCCRARNKEVM